MAVRAGRVRRTACAAVLAAGAALLAACGEGGEEAAGPGDVSPAAATEEAPAPTPSPAPAEDPGTPAETPAAGDLGDRLLPAEAFGPDASVVRLDDPDHDGDDDWWHGGWHGGWGGWGWGWGGWHDHDDDGEHDGLPDGVSVEPAACADVLEALPEPAEDAADPVVAAQAARSGDVHTYQVVAESPELAGLTLPVDQLLGACSSVTVTAPFGWDATAQLAPLDLPAVGGGSAGLQVTVEGWGDTVTMLVGVAVEGSRGLFLTQTAGPGDPAPDAAAFAGLFGDAGAAAFG
ncbi:hypothetical protein ACI8AA_20250 [Geodermatophilus sp. SYSU D01180]